MRKSLVLGMVLALFFLAACAPQEPSQLPVDEPPAVLPGPPALPEEAAPDVEEIDDALDEAFGPRDEAQVITVDDIRCDADTSTVTFRFRNLDEKSWQLNNKVPFPAPADLAGVRVTFNSYEVNGQRRPLDSDGNELFGPGATLAENCGGAEVLAPGEEAVCTISPVPLKAETVISQGANELRINGVGADGVVRFACA